MRECLRSRVLSLSANAKSKSVSGDSSSRVVACLALFIKNIW